MWTNGISWNNNNGITTLVEVIQQNRWVVVTMYHNKDITRPVELQHVAETERKGIFLLSYLWKKHLMVGG